MKLLTDFTAGELSPRFKGRPDLEITGRGCQELTNFIPFWPGGITMRPGTTFVDWIGTNKARLVPFIVSESIAYVIELTPNKIRLWRSGNLLMDGALPLEIPLRYSDPFSLQFAQLGNEFFIAGGDKIFRLTYVDIDQFDYGDFVPSVGNKDMIPFAATGNYPHCIAFHDGRLIAAASDTGPNVIWASKTFDYSNFTYFETLSYTSRVLRDPYLTFQAKTVSGSTTVSEIPENILAKLKAGDRISGDMIPEHPVSTKWQGASLYAVLSSFSVDEFRDAAGSYNDKTITRVVRTSLSRALLQSFNVGSGKGGGFLSWGDVFADRATVTEQSAVLRVEITSGDLQLSYDRDCFEYSVYQNDSKIFQEKIKTVPYSKDININIKAGDIIKISSRDFLLFGPWVLVSGARIFSCACTAIFLYYNDGGYDRIYYSGIYDSPLVLSSPIEFNSSDYTNDPATAEIYNHILSIDIENKSIEIAVPASASGVGSVTTSWANPAHEEYEETTTTRDVVDEDSAYRKEIYGNEKILWLAGGKDLIVGTTTGERIIPAGTNSQNFTCQKQTAHGSAPIQPIMLNDAVIFVGSDRKSLREYVYRAMNEAQLYSAPRLDINADHIFSGIVHLDYSSSSTPFVWAVQDDGTMIGCYRDRYANICAFFRVKFNDALIESVCVVPENGVDTLYLSVNRSGIRALLKMGQLFDGMHLDFAQPVVVEGNTILCNWIDGPAVFVHNGTIYPVTVAGGVAAAHSIPDGAEGYLGIPFTARMKSMPIAENPLKAKQIPSGTIRVMDSYPFKFGYDNALSMAGFAGPFTGDVDVYFSGSWDREGTIVVEHETLPLTILAILLKANHGG